MFGRGKRSLHFQFADGQMRQLSPCQGSLRSGRVSGPAHHNMPAAIYEPLDPHESRERSDMQLWLTVTSQT